MASPSPAVDPWAGRLVGGRWRIVSLLDDSGGMASVYLAEDERLPRKAVVKIPKAAQFNAEFAERFAREAFWHAKVENLHVVHILDRGEEEGTPYLVLQYLPGGNLKAWCGSNPSILADPKLHYDAWLLPIAQALDAVATQGIVHRDVKPSNILFDASGQAYLSDFGIVKAGGEATMTGTGLFIGTLQFMSPEQCQSDSRVTLDGRSDQYGLAVTVYQVITGWQYPVADTTVGQIVTAKLGFAPITEPQVHDPRIPQGVNVAVMRALSPDREQRFPSSVAFAEAVLAGFVSNVPGAPAGNAQATKSLPAAAPRRTPIAPAASPPRSRRLRSAGITVAAAAMVTAAAVWWMSPASSPPSDRSVRPFFDKSPRSFPHASPPAASPPARVAPVPRVTALRPSGPGPFKKGGLLDLTASFSRPVHVRGTPRIGFRVGDERVRREAIFRTGDGSPTLVFSFTVPEGIDDTGLVIDRPAAIELAGGSIEDAATGSPAELTFESPGILAEVRIDSTPPRIVRMSMPDANASYPVDSVLRFAVEFDEPVEVTGEPAVLFVVGSDSRRASLSGGSGTPTLSFAYRVAAGDYSDDGVVATGLTAGGGSIGDAAGNVYDGRFEKVRSGDLAVNGIPPISDGFESGGSSTEPAASALRTKTGEVSTNSVGMKLVVIPAGEFEMGSHETLGQLEDVVVASGIEWPPHSTVADEAPVHLVRITKPFLMGAHEVTLGQFMKFYNEAYEGNLDGERYAKGGQGYEPSNADSIFPEKADYRPWKWGHPNQTDEHPAVNVSWQDAVAFCKWLSLKEEKTYRLPTEAEWEYACRAGRRGWYWNGNDPEKLAEIANVGDRTAKDLFKNWAYSINARDGFALTAPVGSYRANPFGLFDTHGNVTEWCQDWYQENYYSTSPTDDPSGPDAGTFRVRRGGGWDYDSVECRCASRIDGGSPSGCNASTGFRVVCEIK